MTKELYVKNLRQGGAVEYFETGLVKTQGTYKDDLKDGDWVVYDEFQTIVSKDKYKAGVLLKK
jgi:antitoxin component YwqK of YwqJK toxin-antitoxin module